MATPSIIELDVPESIPPNLSEVQPDPFVVSEQPSVQPKTAHHRVEIEQSPRSVSNEQKSEFPLKETRPSIGVINVDNQAQVQRDISEKPKTFGEKLGQFFAKSKWIIIGLVIALVLAGAAAFFYFKTDMMNSFKPSTSRSTVDERVTTAIEAERDEALALVKTCEDQLRQFQSQNNQLLQQLETMNAVQVEQEKQIAQYVDYVESAEKIFAQQAEERAQAECTPSDVVTSEPVALVDGGVVDLDAESGLLNPIVQAAIVTVDIEEAEPQPAVEEIEQDKEESSSQ